VLDASRNPSPEQLEAADLATAFAYATDWLGVYVEEVNALNVYPVPDGDTGTNMHLTMQSVRRQLGDERPKTMAALAHALAYGSLLGARGNSGVILSQVLKGFSEAIRSHTSLSAQACVEALQSATKSAYAAVMKPVEGTILTVVRRAAEGAREAASSRPLDVLREAWRAGEKALKETPEMLPMLKQAGVVDSGGLGFLRVLEGLIASFEGRDLPPPPKVTKRAQEAFEEQEFGFCTEFLLSDVTVPTQEIQELVKGFGDSLLVVGAEGYVKGHIHTEEPEQLLAAVARYGTMVRSKVEDMSEQHQEILAGIDLAEAEPPRSALVAVSAGHGITKVFRSLGARVVGGGQTNNPSVQDIADAVRSVGAREVVIMPNNKNIIMAAERVRELVPDKDVRVLPTRTLGQGLAAAVLFDDAASVEELLPEMQAAAEHARTLEVTTASRSATVDGVEVSEGQFIGLLDGKLQVAASSPEGCLEALLERVADDVEIGALFYNAVVGRERAEAFHAALSERFADLELELHPGAPDLYPYLLALE
jgi:DAK2 domain fusion protein YloV